MGWFCQEHLQVKAPHKHGNIGWFPIKILPTNPSTDGLGIVFRVGKMVYMETRGSEWTRYEKTDLNGAKCIKLDGWFE